MSGSGVVDDGQQQEGVVLGAGVEGDLAAVDLGRTVARVDVDERAAAAQLVGEVVQPVALEPVVEVAAARP